MPGSADKPFYVGDALHAMSAKGEPRPKRALDDPNYSSKYNCLELAKSRGLLRVVRTPANGRNRAILPTAKLKSLMDDFFASTMQFAQDVVATAKDHGIYDPSPAAELAFSVFVEVDKKRQIFIITHNFGVMVAIGMFSISYRATARSTYPLQKMIGRR
ncbi:hypothetical protein [Bradyrhizobium sp. 23]|uniref:hypothetical protein n=1 Tax=Bradyrhizobium sp. 23 TaxID=2782667 RepID=UPI001FFABC17|nr:hypothetical protein [Bradyrhizobium sp. 23]MCK1315492.1 hypothetical protein [Bradyrhizobium sp. 23]